MINSILKFIFIFFFLFFSNAINSQNQIVTGTITDNNNNPLPGVNVVVDAETYSGAVTDFDGNFVVKADAEATLIISYVGFITQEVKVNGNKNLNIKMEEDLFGLEEVTVVAYGQQKKQSVIAAVTSVDPTELRVPTSNLTTSLAGRVAGLISYQRSGEPGRDNAEFFIRGVSTFGYARSPLILIDGIETTSTDLARLQPDDIASFSIMKDATATALYGARGANGVIMVTTKEGKQGKVKLNIRYEKAYSAAARKVQK